MATAPAYQYQYLESIDSVRMPYPGPAGVPGFDDPVRRSHELQIFLEVLMALALGRQIVVPQVYAFDSHSFQRVATAVLKVRDDAAPDQHPFRLHLFGALSYDEVVSTILRRLHDEERPFVSSLLPEVHDPERYGLDAGRVREQVRDLDRLLASEWIGDERSAGLSAVQRAFHRVPVVRPEPPATALGLDALVARFVDSSPAMAREALGFGPATREVHAELLDSLHRLDPERREPFGQRSRLRRPAPWPGDPRGRTPESIVGGAERLDLVVEFVDTLYNSVVAESIGVAPALFSTDVAPTDRALTSRVVAQRLALADSRWRTTQAVAAAPAYSAASPDGLEEAGESEESPLFEVCIDDRAVRDVAADGSGRGSDVAAAISRIQDGAKDGLGALFVERAAPGSRFSKGLDRLNEALADSDQHAAQRALDAHLGHVARLLGGQLEPGGPSGWARLGLGGAAAGANASVAAAQAFLQYPAALDFVDATAAGTAAALAAVQGARFWRRRQDSRRLVRALGTVAVVQRTR